MEIERKKNPAKGIKAVDEESSPCASGDNNGDSGARRVLGGQ